jgi:hypothetical protein
MLMTRIMKAHGQRQASRATHNTHTNGPFPTHMRNQQGTTPCSSLWYVYEQVLTENVRASWVVDALKTTLEQWAYTQAGSSESSILVERLRKYNNFAYYSRSLFFFEIAVGHREKLIDVV